MISRYWQALAEIWPWIWLHDVGRYAVAATIFFALFWIVLRKALAKRRIQGRDPGLSQMSREVLYSITTATIFSATGLILYFGTLAGATTIYTDVSDYGRLYWVVSIALTLVLHDAYFYWTHRLLHHPRLFRYTHSVHHLSRSLHRGQPTRFIRGRPSSMGSFFRLWRSSSLYIRRPWACS